MGKQIYISEKEIEAIYNAIEQIEHDYDSADKETLEWAREQIMYLNRIIEKYNRKNN
jgi:hypothetical protein